MSFTCSRSRTWPSVCILPAEQDRDAVADVLHVGQQVAAEQDRLALLLEREDQVLHLARADRVEAGRRLVEQDQVGVVDQRLGQADAAGHALGILAKLALAALASRPTMSSSSGTRRFSSRRGILNSLP